MSDELKVVNLPYDNILMENEQLRAENESLKKKLSLDMVIVAEENDRLREENEKLTRLCHDKFGPAGLKHVHEIMDERDSLASELSDAQHIKRELECARQKLAWLCEHAVESACISKAKASELLGQSLIDYISVRDKLAKAKECLEFCTRTILKRGDGPLTWAQETQKRARQTLEKLK